jgi:hypothetical protein
VLGNCPVKAGVRLRQALVFALQAADPPLYVGRPSRIELPLQRRKLPQDGCHLGKQLPVVLPKRTLARSDNLLKRPRCSVVLGKPVRQELQLHRLSRSVVNCWTAGAKFVFHPHGRQNRARKVALATGYHPKYFTI